MTDLSKLKLSRFDVRSIDLTHPERWWLATRTLLTELVDPDIEDGAQRHDDRDELRWNTLGAILTEISVALQQKNYRRRGDDPHLVTIDVTPVEGGLTLAEAEVLESWFTYDESPRGDAWNVTVSNGRHRLFNVWAHHTNAALPIRSDLLDYTDEVDSERLAETIRDSATAGLASLPTIVRGRSPEYVAQLHAAANITPRA